MILAVFLALQERPEKKNKHSGLKIDSYPDLTVFIIDPDNDQLPVGLVAQLAEHCPSITAVRVANPLSGLSRYSLSSAKRTARIIHIQTITELTTPVLSPCRN